MQFNGMNQPVKREHTMTVAQSLASVVNGNQSAILDHYRQVQAIKYHGGKAWRKFAGDYLSAIRDTGELVSRPIFVRGNGKLPFWSFSALPVVLCPGAGDCAKYCYSLRAWRYPAAFFRQAQNSLLLSTARGRELITQAWQALPEGEHVRLYVDGDFNSVQDVKFWFSLCRLRPDLKVYGYSKSFAFIVQACEEEGLVPDNYILNLSNGSNATPEIIERARKLPITRGEFIALPGKGKSKQELIREHKKASGKPTFFCPGECGSCTAKTHACGSKTFENVDIIIAIH